MYANKHEMDNNKPCNNLGRHGTDDWTIIIKFPICVVHPPFNFRCITIENFFDIFDFSLSSACAKVGHGNFESSVVDNSDPFFPSKIHRVIMNQSAFKLENST